MQKWVPNESYTTRSEMEFPFGFIPFNLQSEASFNVTFIIYVLERTQLSIMYKVISAIMTQFSLFLVHALKEWISLPFFFFFNS